MNCVQKANKDVGLFFSQFRFMNWSPAFKTWIRDEGIPTIILIVTIFGGAFMAAWLFDPSTRVAALLIVILGMVIGAVLGAYLLIIYSFCNKS